MKSVAKMNVMARSMLVNRPSTMMRTGSVVQPWAVLKITATTPARAMEISVDLSSLLPITNAATIATAMMTMSITV